MPSNDTDEVYCLGISCHLCSTPPTSPPPCPPPPPSSPVSRGGELENLLAGPNYQPHIPIFEIEDLDLDRNVALPESSELFHHDSITSSARPRSASSISMSQVPSYMSHGQILPASGLSTVVFPPSPTSSPPNFSPTEAFTAQTPVNTSEDETIYTEEEEGPRLPHEKPSPRPTICYRYKVQPTRPKSNSQPDRMGAFTFKGYTSIKKRHYTSDEETDEEDAESGGVLIRGRERTERSPSLSPTREEVRTEKFPGFNYSISESLLTREPIVGTMPVIERGREVMEYKHPLLDAAVPGTSDQYDTDAVIIPTDFKFVDDDGDVFIGAQDNLRA